MAKHIVWRGLLAGLLAAIPAFLIAKLLAEPQIQLAIDYEGAREAAVHALEAAAGNANLEHEHEVFTRAVQSLPGLAAGLLLIGGAYGLLVAATYGMLRRQALPVMSPRLLALLLAAGGLLCLYVFPSLKYPPNPPAIGHEETIGARTTLFLVMIGVSLCGMILAVWLAARVHERFGWWNAVLLGGALFLGIQIAAELLLPQLGHLQVNVDNYGRHATETPLALKDASGRIVFPGFPADVLAKFRLYSIANQTVLWLGVGLIFGALVQRYEAPAAATAAERSDFAATAGAGQPA